MFGVDPFSILMVAAIIIVGCSVFYYVVFSSNKDAQRMKSEAVTVAGIVVTRPETTTDRHGNKTTNLTIASEGGTDSYNFGTTKWPALQSAALGDQVRIYCYVDSVSSTVYDFYIVRESEVDEGWRTSQPEHSS